MSTHDEHPRRELDPKTLTRDELEAQASALRTVLAISDAVHLSRDFQDLAERAVGAIVTYTPYASVALFCLDEKERHLRLIAARGFADETVARARTLSLDASLTGIAVGRGEIVTTADVAHDRRVDRCVQAALAGEGYTDVASVPLLFRDRAMGALNVIYRDAGLTSHERQTLMAIGRTIGLAMANRLAAEEQRRLEAQVRRSEQLSALGVLAGGIAHDFNNLLAGFLVNVSTASRIVRGFGPSAATALECLDEAEKAVARARGLVRQLLTFARGGAPVKTPTDQIGPIVRDAAEFATRGSSVRAEVRIAEGLGTVEVDAGQVAQVVQNLVLNAVQASAEGSVVRVDLDLQPDDVDPHGRWLRLRVSDEGRGIAADALPRIFEPYFTTREEGTGLGLATTHSIVERHGGHLDVESKPGVGSTFTAYFPVGSPTAPAPRAVAAAPQTGTGRILVVDDEPAIVRAVTRMLGLLGYEAAGEAEGRAAIHRYEEARRAGRPFDVVLLDLTIAGGLGGKETMARLRALDPSVKAIVTSGYSADAVMADYRGHGFAAVLEKPYTVESLSEALRTVMAGG